MIISKVRQMPLTPGNWAALIKYPLKSYPGKLNEKLGSLSTGSCMFTLTQGGGSGIEAQKNIQQSNITTAIFYFTTGISHYSIWLQSLALCVI